MEKLISFFHTVGKLKTTKRAGWLNYKIEESESIADHSHRTALLAMIFAKRFGADELRTIKMALLHDLAEAVTGDIITERGEEAVYSREQKLKKEQGAIEEILIDLDAQEKEELLSLWLEGENGESPEAKLARQLCKLEMAMQAFEYEKENPSQKLDEFFIVAKKYVQDEKLQKLLEELLSKR